MCFIASLQADLKVRLYILRVSVRLYAALWRLIPSNPESQIPNPESGHCVDATARIPLNA